MHACVFDMSLDCSGIGPVHFVSPSFKTGTTLCTAGLGFWFVRHMLDTC